MNRPPMSMRMLSVPILRRLLVAMPPNERMLRGASSRMGHRESDNGGVEKANEFVVRIPNAQLELLPGGGHASWLDDLDRAAEATTDFLRDEWRPHGSDGRAS